MAITGVHTIIYSRDADADRAFFRDVLKLPHVDAGGGWLIFGLPPAELAAHPTEGDTAFELYLMCDDIRATVADLTVQGVDVRDQIQAESFGAMTSLTLPGGGELGLYEPSHPTPARP
jgi:hypothetical protein